MAFKKSYSRSNKTGFPPLLFVAFSSNNTAVAVSGDLNSDETNKRFLANTAKIEAIYLLILLWILNVNNITYAYEAI